MTKEECSEALTRLLRPYFASTEIQDAYHDINKGYSIDHDSNIITSLIKEHFNTQPYKFENLHKGMWVWDDIFKEICFISSIVDRNKIYVEFLESHCSIEPCKILIFEEGRFFPLTKALEYQNE